jgi:copper homeostasis protein
MTWSARMLAFYESKRPWLRKEPPAFSVRVYIGPMGVRVEVCVTSIDEALAAAGAGVDSLELCTWLGSGGLTPSWGLFKAVQAHCAIPVRVLVRPAPGSFVHDGPTREALLLDVERFAGEGASVVTGGLRHDGTIDQALMGAIRSSTNGFELSLHRAIDHARDLPAAADLSVQLGVDRILSSGGAPTALEGVHTLRQLTAAHSSIVIAAAGGIRPENVVELVERSGVGEVHFSAQRWIQRQGQVPLLSTDPAATNASVAADLKRIEGVLNALVNAGLR